MSRRIYLRLFSESKNINLILGIFGSDFYDAMYDYWLDNLDGIKSMSTKLGLKELRNLESCLEPVYKFIQKLPYQPIYYDDTENYPVEAEKLFYNHYFDFTTPYVTMTDVVRLYNLCYTLKNIISINNDIKDLCVIMERSL